MIRGLELLTKFEYQLFRVYKDEILGNRNIEITVLMMTILVLG